MNKYRVEIVYFDGRLKTAVYCEDCSRDGDYLLLIRNGGKDCEIIYLRQEYRFRICEVKE